MNTGIMEEVYFFLNSLVMGILITFVYDFLIILRKVIRHNIFFISLEDLLFWIATAIAIFAMLYEENNGVPRWFSIVGAMVGMMVYKLTVSRWYVMGMTKVLHVLLYLLSRVVIVLAKPVVAGGKQTVKGFRKIRRWLRKIGRFCKNKLTACKKVFRMILCKR